MDVVYEVDNGVVNHTRAEVLSVMNFLGKNPNESTGTAWCSRSTTYYILKIWEGIAQSGSKVIRWSCLSCREMGAGLPSRAFTTAVQVPGTSTVLY